MYGVYVCVCVWKRGCVWENDREEEAMNLKVWTEEHLEVLEGKDMGKMEGGKVKEEMI